LSILKAFKVFELISDFQIPPSKHVLTWYSCYDDFLCAVLEVGSKHVLEMYKFELRLLLRSP
jgi:hypothetical protein